ncbi:MAG: N-6 DNA methylase, partial [Methanosarcinales archaeon]
MKAMQEIEKYIKYDHILFLSEKLRKYDDYIKANSILKDITGINNFFDDQTSYLFFKKVLYESIPHVSDSERREYGDLQTPDELTDIICSLLTKSNFYPQSVIEPTFGKGSFIISSLKHFKSIETVVGIEIYNKYVWETKFKILKYFLDNPQKNKPEICLYKQDIFNFDFNLIKEKINGSILVLGNPPWITNAKLSSLNSNNLPNKSNLKNLKGLDAITGKGNFDISEFISLLMLKNFCNFHGKMAFLIKNSVIKNLVQDFRKFNFCISNIKTYKIDAKKYFNASVDASLFT